MRSYSLILFLFIGSACTSPDYDGGVTSTTQATRIPSGTIVPLPTASYTIEPIIENAPNSQTPMPTLPIATQKARTPTPAFDLTNTAYVQTVEAFNEYYDPGFHLTIKYPSNWVRTGFREFKGADGELRLYELSDYHSYRVMFVCGDYLFRNFAGKDYFEDVRIIRLGFNGRGGCVAMGIPQKLISIIPFELSHDGVNYMIMELKSPETYPIDFLTIANRFVWHDDSEFYEYGVGDDVQPMPETKLSELSIQEIYAGKAQDGLSVRGIHFSDYDYIGSSAVEAQQYCDWAFTDDTASIELDGNRYEAYSENGKLIVKRNDEIVFSSPEFKVWTMMGARKLCGYDGHWILEDSGYLVEDGVILNHELGYEDMFDWRLLLGKPYYFYVKGGETFVSYDGQTLPISYDYVPHYGCCALGTLTNPHGNNAQAWFYGIRDGIWYFVIIEQR